MKIVVKALEDTDMSHGDVKLKASEGEKLELSTREAEIALSTGKFEFVEEVTESKAEENFIQNQQSELEIRKAELMKLGKDELTEQAKDLDGYKSSMKKEELVDLILKPRAPVVTDTQNKPPESGEKGDE